MTSSTDSRELSEFKTITPHRGPGRPPNAQKQQQLPQQNIKLMNNYVQPQQQIAYPVNPQQQIVPPMQIQRQQQIPPTRGPVQIPPTTTMGYAPITNQQGIMLGSSPRQYLPYPNTIKNVRFN